LFRGAGLVCVAALTAAFGVNASADEVVQLGLGCLKGKKIHAKDVGTAHVLFEYDYYDDCPAPARTWVEYRAGGDWSETWSIFTKNTNDAFVTRDLRIGGLKRNTRYEMRSRIEFFGDRRSTDPVSFRTGGDPARDVVISGEARDFGATSVRVRALVTTAGDNDVRLNINQIGGNRHHGGGKLERISCDQRPGDYALCEWGAGLKLVRFAQDRPDHGFWTWAGSQYAANAVVSNSLYTREFGDQKTQDAFFVAGTSSSFEAGLAGR
jgi:hypothetical protein